MKKKEHMDNIKKQKITGICKQISNKIKIENKDSINKDKIKEICKEIPDKILETKIFRSQNPPNKQRYKQIKRLKLKREI